MMPERIEKVLRTLSKLGRGTAVTTAQRMLMPHVIRVFTEHDHEELRRMILANYPLVEQETPDNVKAALRNLGSNEDLRQQWEGVVTTHITPENILSWLQQPEEWGGDEFSDEHIMEIKLCAATIEETHGGKRWLEEQVLELYKYAGIVPPDVTLDVEND